jgi:hypothetical protein
MLTLEMYFVKDENALRVTVQHQSAAEVAAMQKELDEQAAAAKKKKEQEENTPLPTIVITLPPGAELTESGKTRLEFTVATGKGKTVAEAIRKKLKDSRWKEEVLTADAAVGEITFTKDQQEITLSYVDPGFIPAEFTIRGTRVELTITGKD